MTFPSKLTLPVNNSPFFSMGKFCACANFSIGRDSKSKSDKLTLILIPEIVGGFCCGKSTPTTPLALTFGGIETFSISTCSPFQSNIESRGC